MDLEDILRQRLHNVGEEIGDSELIVDENEVLDALALADHLVEAKIVGKTIKGIFENESDAKRTIIALQHFNYYRFAKRDAVNMVLDCLMYDARTFTDAANAAQALDVAEVHGLLKKYVGDGEMEYDTEQVYSNVLMSLCHVARGTQNKNTVVRVANFLDACEPNEIDAATGCFVKLTSYIRDTGITNKLCAVFEKELNEDRDSLVGTMNYFDRFILNHSNEPHLVRNELERQLNQ